MPAELDKVATDFVVIRSGKIIEQFTKEEIADRRRTAADSCGWMM